jgi:hypothetical protein
MVSGSARKAVALLSIRSRADGLRNYFLLLLAVSGLLNRLKVRESEKRNNPIKTGCFSF